MIGKWDCSVRKYEKRKDEKGEQLKLTGRSEGDRGQKYVALRTGKGSCVQQEEAEHVQRPEAIEGIIDARIGADIKEVVIKSAPQGGRAGRGDLMDVDAFTKGNRLWNGLSAFTAKFKK